MSMAWLKQEIALSKSFAWIARAPSLASSCGVCPWVSPSTEIVTFTAGVAEGAGDGESAGAVSCANNLPASNRHKHATFAGRVLMAVHHEKCAAKSQNN